MDLRLARSELANVLIELGNKIMKSKAVLFGHPLHPMLIPFPFAFLTGALVFDAIGWLRDVPAWWTTGSHLSLAGIVNRISRGNPRLD
jgi:Predicted membrane protein (DUF2231)